MGFFDGDFDLEAFKADFEKLNEVKKEYAEVEAGQYEVRVVGLELGKTKDGSKDMVKVRYRIIAGVHTGNYLFQNQVITKGFQIKIINDLLESFESGLEIKFEDQFQWLDLIDKVKIAIEDKEYGLDYGENNKGFKTFKITNVF